MQVSLPLEYVSRNVVLKIILNVSDKDFNLFCTDKLLMREMFNISELVIN
jgi:hypothetical protein